MGMLIKRRLFSLLAIAVTAACLSAPASASASWVVPGRGFGHGVGMSQYGALGYAQQGRSYRQILHHYYTGVKIREANTRAVRVLITTGLSSLPFSGATKACGKNLSPGKSYSFRDEGSTVSLRRPNGSRAAACGGQGSAKGGASVRFNGVGEYRGQLRARNVGGTIYAINSVGIEDYVRGVIRNEVPASWPAHALRAQAVAARSYALATRLSGDGYNLYDDTRSQVYGGRTSEAARTNQAVGATAREVIKSGGSTATAFFFSTSGGRTENSEFGYSGGSSRPYLKSVKDPFDDVSPSHRWTERFTNAQMSSKLAGLFSGRLKRIRILRTGRSPRIVRARVVGSSGSTEVSGDTLSFRLGLRSTWARFNKR